MSELYRDYIDGKADEIINSLGGTITPAPANAELYRDFLDRKFDDVINGIAGLPKLKKVQYIGDDANPKVVTFPDTPTLILCINGSSGPARLLSSAFIYGVSERATGFINQVNFVETTYAFELSYNGNEMTITASNPARAFNGFGNTITIYYI